VGQLNVVAAEVPLVVLAANGPSHLESRHADLVANHVWLSDELVSLHALPGIHLEHALD
jgi:hypothetical protein